MASENLEQFDDPIELSIEVSCGSIRFLAFVWSICAAIF